jgi:surfeit locus 1 family protein
MPISFRFRWLPFVAAMLLVALGVTLGQWQMRRGAEKAAIESLLSAREAAPVMALGGTKLNGAELEFRRVNVRGSFLPEWPVYLENRPYKGMAGVYVVMPFRIAGSDRHVLVERGWIARDAADRTRLPVIPTPAGEIELSGSVRRQAGRLLQLGRAQPLAPGAFVQNIDTGQFAAASGLATEDFIIEQADAPQAETAGGTGLPIADGLVRDWPRPSLGVDRHYGYAFQWYALAATAFLFFIVTGFRRGPTEPAVSDTVA